jgi:uncharacterized protein involved in exopolysaccharide biosynthesis
MEIRRANILGFTLFMAGLVLCGIGLWLLLSPAQYRATARIKVELDEIGINGIGGPAGAYDPYYIPTTFEVIQSQIVLGRVINSLNLNVEWGNKYGGGGTLTTNAAIVIIRKHLNLVIERDTKLVEISFTSDDPNEAARVANAIAKAYQDYRLETRRQMTLKGIEVLRQLYLEEEKKIQIQQTNVDLLHKELAPQILQAQQERTNRIEIHEATPDQPYWEAKRKLENMVDFHKLIQAKIAALKMDIATPMFRQMVTIIDAAQPPKSPASPNRFLGAVLLSIGLFPTVGGLLTLKSSRHPVRL